MIQAQERDALQAQTNLEELVERISHALPKDGRSEPLDGLFLFRASAPTELHHAVLTPAFCLIAQGSKEVLVGDDRYRYDPYNYLLATIQLPIVSQVIEASKERPYLSLRFDLDSTLVSSVMVEAGHGSSRRGTDVSAFAVSPLEPDLRDAIVRLVRLMDSPAEAAVLKPLIEREIVFRLLMGEQGDRLRHVAVLGGHAHRVASAVERLRRDFDKPLSIEGVADDMGMSVSSFHHHFKAVTGMSPLRFQKQLRLQEARRLMLGENLDASTAGYRVGYNDASHFSREYKRFFGQPPRQDVERLREAEGAAAG